MINLSAAIVVAAALIAGAMLTTNHYSIRTYEKVAWKMNTWTGAVQFCVGGTNGKCYPLEVRH